MREALRRILWIVPTLLTITVGAFWLVSKVGAPTAEAHRDELPLFINLEPQSGGDLAKAALRHVALNDDDGTARALLVRLGGSALPHVLPELDSLEPTGRGRVALALMPIAHRMRLASLDEAEDAEEAVVFWTRFWQDRNIDFRPSVVRRAVRRYSERPSDVRRSDIVQLDTFALPELIDVMRPVESPADVERVRRIAKLAHDVTGVGATVPVGATVEETRRVVDEWERWWGQHNAEYQSFDGARRVLTMLTATQYGTWARDAVENRLGPSESGEPVLDVMRRAAPTTAWLVLVGLLGGWAAGAVWGMLGAAFARRPVDWATSTAAIALIAIPATVIACWLAPSSARSLLASVVMVLVTAALVSRHQRAAARASLDQEFIRTDRALGAGPLRIAVRCLRPASTQVISLLPIELPAVLTTSFVVEHGFGLDGLAAVTLSAIESRHVAWLMAMTVSIALVVAVVQIFSDNLLAALDPRIRVAVRRRQGLE